MARVVAQTVEIGPLFSADTAPDLDIILLWDSGGYVDLTDALVTGYVRRWDPAKKVPLAALITSGQCSLLAATRGECTLSWQTCSPLSSVPIDPGWYVVQVAVQFPDGTTQESQRAVFEVLPHTAEEV